MTGEEESVEDIRELSVGSSLPLRKRSVYDDFVEGVATRNIAKQEGVDESRAARVFQVVDNNGERSIHLIGRKDVVSEIGDTLERGGYRVREWHIRRPQDRSLEIERIKPEVEKFLASAPAEVVGLARQPSLDGRVVSELREVLKPFGPGNQTKREGGE